MTKATPSPEANAPKLKPAIKEPALSEAEKLEQAAIGYRILVNDGKAPKLSPKSTGQVYYQIAVKEADKQLYLRMIGNDGGGLHSKHWISLTEIFTILDEQKEQTFKSVVLRPAIKGGSSNNTGFVAAILRSKDIGLICQSESNVYLHRLADDVEAKKQALLNLGKTK